MVAIIVLAGMAVMGISVVAGAIALTKEKKVIQRERFIVPLYENRYSYRKAKTASVRTSPYRVSIWN